MFEFAVVLCFFFFQAEDGIRDSSVTGVQTCALPISTRAMQNWTPLGRRGFAQGLTHAFARLGNAITPPIVAWLIALVAWRGSFIALGCCSLVWVVIWFWYFRGLP